MVGERYLTKREFETYVRQTNKTLTSLRITQPGATGGGASHFTGLMDVPGSYSGQANKIVAVNATENALAFTATPTVTSITISGLTSGRLPIVSVGGLLISVPTLLYDSALNQMIINQNAVAGAASLAGTALSIRGADNGQVRFNTSSFGIAGMAAYAQSHARNTALAPQAVQAGDVIFSIEGWGYGATGYSVSPRAFIRGYANQTWDDAKQSSHISFWTSPIDTIVPARRWSILADGSFVSALDGSAANEIKTAGSVTASHLHLSDLAAVYTPAESWIGPSSTAGIYFKSGYKGMGTTTPGAFLDLSWGGYQGVGALRIGADIGDVSTRTNATNKFGVISCPHYTNAEQNILLMSMYSQAATSPLWIGGGDSNWNAVSEIVFYTALDNVTVTGTERMRIDHHGNVGIGGIPERRLDVIQSASTFDQLQLSQVTGDSYRRGGIVQQHGKAAEESILMIGCYSRDTDVASDNTLLIGGGIANLNAAMDIIFYTAANGNTLTGTERVRINPDGKVLIASLKAAQSHPTNYKAVYVDTDTGELYRIA